jgi:hypothetical protein
VAMAVIHSVRVGFALMLIAGLLSTPILMDYPKSNHPS